MEPDTHPGKGRSSGLGIALQVVGAVLVVGAMIVCAAYGMSHMPNDPVQKAQFKRTVRTAGTLPVLGGVFLFLLGRKKSKG